MDSKKEIKAAITKLTDALSSEDPSSKLPEIVKKFTAGDAKAKDKTAKVLLETAAGVTDAIVWWLYRGMTCTEKGTCYGGSQTDPVCAWVYDWTQTNTPHTRAFVLQLFPAFVWAYYAGYSGLLRRRSDADAASFNFSGVEACLLAVHNLNVHEIDKGVYNSPFMHPLLKFDSVYCTGLSDMVEENSEAGDATSTAYKKKMCTPKRVICDGDRNEIVSSTLSMLIKHFSALTDKTKLAICKVVREVSCLGYPFNSYSQAKGSRSALDVFYPGLDDETFGSEAEKMLSENGKGAAEGVIRVRHSERLFSYALSLLRLCISTQELLPLVASAGDAIKAAAVYNNFLMSIITADALIKITENLTAEEKLTSETTTKGGKKEEEKEKEKEKDDDDSESEEGDDEKEEKKKEEKKKDTKESEESEESEGSEESEESEESEDKKKDKKEEKKAQTEENSESETDETDETDETSESESSDDEKKIKLKTKK